MRRNVLRLRGSFFVTHCERYVAVMSDGMSPKWLATDWLLSQFGKRRAAARQAYQQFVLDGLGLPSPLLATKHQLFLGDQSFIEQHALLKDDIELHEVSKTQRRALTQPLAYFALAFGVYTMTVSRAVRAAEAKAALARVGG